jgi:predicted O-methyltransferase YrrM
VVRGIKKKPAPISNLKMFTLQGKKSWYMVLKKTGTYLNLKMFIIQRKKIVERGTKKEASTSL